jgi:hypothetical protein
MVTTGQAVVTLLIRTQLRRDKNLQHDVVAFTLRSCTPQISLNRILTKNQIITKGLKSHWQGF